MSRQSFTPASLEGVSEEDMFPVPVEEGRRQIMKKYEQFHLVSILSTSTPIGFFCCNNPIVARLQQGPTCGLVSLRMAAESIINRLSASSNDLPSQTLLKFAQEKGITFSGEMFSAADMSLLAEKYYSPKIHSNCWSSPWDGSFLENYLLKLCNGSMVLAPYDVDKNHEPCNQGGKKSHWAALKGFVLPLFASSQLEYCKSLCKSEAILEYSVNGLPFFFLEPDLTQKADFSISQIVDLNDPLLCSHLSIIAQQSKSKHQALWKYSSFKDSNHNLYEFDSDRIATAQAEGQPLKVPPELGELRGKAVFLSPHHD